MRAMSWAEGTIWNEISKRTKAAKEVKADRWLLEELKQAAASLQSQLQNFKQSKALLAEYEVVWRQLLVCRRSELMCCIPLTSQRLSQLQSVVSTTAAAAQAAVPPVKGLLSTLGAYATVNKSTAEELQQTPETASLAADKLQLSLLEEQLIAALQQLINSSNHQLALHIQQQHAQQQQQQQQSQQQQQQSHQQLASVVQARMVSAAPTNSYSTGVSPATVSARQQAVTPAAATAPATLDQSGMAASNSRQQGMQQHLLQQQVLLVQGPQQLQSVNHEGHQQQQQQPTLQQQQHVLQQRQQQLELQLQQMGQLLQQQPEIGERALSSSANIIGNGQQKLQQQTAYSQAQTPMSHGQQHVQHQQQQPTLHPQLQQQHTISGGGGTPGASTAATGPAGILERLGLVHAADAVGQTLPGSAAAAAWNADDVDTGMAGSSLPSQEPQLAAGAADTTRAAAALAPLSAAGTRESSHTGKPPSAAVQHFAIQGAHAPAVVGAAAGSARPEDVPDNRQLAAAAAWCSGADVGPQTQARPWDGIS